MSELTIKEIRARFTADMSGYRREMERAAEESRQMQERIQQIGAAMEQASHLSNREMRQIGSSLTTASRQAAQYGVQTQRLVSDHRQLARAVEEQQRVLNGLEAEYQTAQAEGERLSGVYDTIRAATEGIDLSTPLGQQVDQAAAELDRINGEIQALQAELAQASPGMNILLSDNSIISLEEGRARLAALVAESDRASARLWQLDAAAQAVGAENLGYASAAGLRQLQGQISASQSKLSGLSGQAAQTADRMLTYGERLNRVDAQQEALAQSAEQTAARLSTLSQTVAAPSLWTRMGAAVSSVASTVRGALASGLGGIAERLRSVRTAGDGVNGSLTRVVRSIRNIGVVALGLKAVRTLFGELRSVVTQYLSENEAAQTAVNNLKSAFANALAPAINIAINALNALLPYIQAVSNAFATLFTNLFGAEWTTISGGASVASSSLSDAADAAGEAAEAQEAYNKTIAGFDQITKLEDNSGSSGSGGSSGGGTSGGTTTETTGGGSGLLGQFSAFMEELAALIKDGAWTELGTYLAESFGSAIDQLYGILTSQETYAKIDSAVTALGETVNSFFARVTLIEEDTGTSIAERTGQTLGAAINLAAYTVNSTVTGISWEQVGLAIAQGINGVVEEADFSLIGETVANVLLVLPRTLVTVVTETDWGGVAAAVSEALVSAFGTISSWVKSVDWSQVVTAIEGALAGVDWSGITSSLADLLGSAFGAVSSSIAQLCEDIWTAIVEGFSSIPSYLTEKIAEAGGNVGAGILNGILDAFMAIDQWVYDNILKPFVDGFKAAFGIASPASAPELVSAAEYVGEGILEGIASVFSDVQTWVKKNILTPISNALGGAKAAVEVTVSLVKGTWSSISSFVGTAVEVAVSLAKSKWSSIASFVGTAVSVTVNLLKGTWTSISNFVGTTVSAGLKLTKSGWTSLSSFVGTAVSAAVKLTRNGWTSISKFVGTSASVGIKLFKSGWTTLSKFIGSFTKSIGLKLTWKTSGLSTLQKAIAKVLFGSAKWPKLSFAARGGIVDGATLFGGSTVVGEAGQEAIIPLERHTEWLDLVADRLAAREQTGGGAGQQIINVYVGEEKLVSKVVQGVNDITRRTGACPIVV